MNYFDKELENQDCTEASQITKELLWLDANGGKKGNSKYGLFVYLFLMCAVIGCFYLLSCAVFGFGWIRNIIQKADDGGNFQFVLPLADKPELQGGEFYQADGRYTVAGIAQLMKESSVSIYAYGDVIHSGVAQGSGFIFSEDGYIVTNAHVIDIKDAHIKVTLWDGRMYNGKIVGMDAVTDIAVLKISATGLKPVIFGDSSQLIQGEEIVAYGNPAGYNASVTAGIVSALGRTVKLADIDIENCIQFDAAVNPGNSGGALLNMWGQVVGIVSAKMESDYYDGIGFAISTVEAKPVIESLIEQGCVVGRVKIGIEFYEITEEMAADSDTLVPGLYIVNVSEDCDIYNTGLTAGDIIVELGGKKVTTSADISLAISKKKPGDVMKFVYLRDGERHESEFALMDAGGYRVTEIVKP